MNTINNFHVFDQNISLRKYNPSTLVQLAEYLLIDLHLLKMMASYFSVAAKLQKQTVAAFSEVFRSNTATLNLCRIVNGRDVNAYLFQEGQNGQRPVFILQENSKYARNCNRGFETLARIQRRNFTSSILKVGCIVSIISLSYSVLFQFLFQFLCEGVCGCVDVWLCAFWVFLSVFVFVFAFALLCFVLFCFVFLFFFVFFLILSTKND